MIVSRGTYTRTAQDLLSSNGTAAYLSTPPNLVDGIPSSQCALSWPSGAQTTAVYIHMPWRMTPVPATECRLFALLGLDTIPADTLVRLYGGNTSNPATPLGETRTVTLPDGTVGAWILFEAGAGFTHEYYAWRVLNDVDGVASIAASAVCYVGEIYGTPVWEWPANQVNVNVIDPSPKNRTDGGSVGTFHLDPYRRCSVTITPQTWAAGMLGADSLQAMLYDLAAQDQIAVVARPEHAGQVVDEASVEAHAMIATLSSNSGLGYTAQLDRSQLQLEFDESL